MNQTGAPAGYQRFEYFFTRLQMLLANASKKKNPALWLYNNDARTPLFMLEGLARIYAGLHNKKKFTGIKEQVKLFEDALGAIDYYDVMAKSLAGNKKIPAEAIDYLRAQTREKVQGLNELLEEKRWLATKDSRIAGMQKKLESANWLSGEEEVNRFATFYNRQISRIIEFTKEKKYHFASLENDVHELRRKLRWLSIYPQALQGCIQLTDNRNIPPHLKKYLVDEIVKSAFNKMPAAGNIKYFLELERNVFYSLSWMIAELGTIKDKGLQIVALEEAIQQAGLTVNGADKNICRLLNQEDIPALLKKAEAICKIYFEERNLEKLVAGTGKAEAGQ